MQLRLRPLLHDEIAGDIAVGSAVVAVAHLDDTVADDGNRAAKYPRCIRP